MIAAMSIGSTTKRVRLAASPLIVAVALGLLGPGVLDEEEFTPSDVRSPSDSELGDMLTAITHDLQDEIGMQGQS
jgi:hypothetical protein